jgi:hypothetical protein
MYVVPYQKLSSISSTELYTAECITFKLMPYIIVRMSWACSFDEDGIWVFTAKTGKNVLRRLSRRWEDDMLPQT